MTSSISFASFLCPPIHCIPTTLALLCLNTQCGFPFRTFVIVLFRAATQFTLSYITFYLLISISLYLSGVTMSIRLFKKYVNSLKSATYSIILQGYPVLRRYWQLFAEWVTHKIHLGPFGKKKHCLSEHSACSISANQ